MKSTENAQIVQDMLGNAPRGCWIPFGQCLKWVLADPSRNAQRVLQTFSAHLKKSEGTL